MTRFVEGVVLRDPVVYLFQIAPGCARDPNRIDHLVIDDMDDDTFEFEAFRTRFGSLPGDLP